MSSISRLIGVLPHLSGSEVGAIDQVAIMWFAIVALAAKALEEGLQPQREIERYQSYRVAVRVVAERFENAQTPYDRFIAMQELERASYEEMRLFLRTNFGARFVV